MGLNAGPRLHEKLDLVYPSEGIVTADYPLMLLNSAKRQAYAKLTQYLRSRDVQLRVQRDTSRRPAVPGVPLDPKFTQTLLVEAPFPANLSVVQQLLDDFQTTLRKPAHTFYVLDTSGSMQGDRLNRLKAALNGLAGSDTSFTGHFARFAPREKVTLIPFNGGVYDTRTFDIDSTDPNSPGLADLRGYINGLRAEGGTAIYSALDQAYSDAGGARQAEPDSYISIVLMTDGENNAGISANRFLDDVRALPPNLQNVRVFSVLFGEANPDALKQIADATGGKVFDARTANLADVFKEIRGYQ
jgi:Ca-activated chloride channel family protein